MQAIEKLIGQAIPKTGHIDIAADDESTGAEGNGRPHEHRKSRNGQRSRRGRGKAAAVDAAAVPPPSIGRVPAARPPREQHSEPADHSHLPAFLLRPIRARG
jgi:hypothetical protein